MTTNLNRNTTPFSGSKAISAIIFRSWQNVCNVVRKQEDNQMLTKKSLAEWSEGVHACLCVCGFVWVYIYIYIYINYGHRDKRI